MFRARWFLSALMIGLVLAPSAARARAMNVDIWTDRGKDAIYEPNEPIEIKVRASDDGYLLVYDIDSEGYVRVLYPYAGSSGYIAAQRTYRVPPAGSGLQLVVQGPVGEGYIVAIVSREPFNALPRYLRPYDPQAENAGYVGEDEGRDEDAEVTTDGRIMGDPFVAMERIRRHVLYRSDDPDAFGTAYTSYYIHEAVRYPRYLCNDCHRPSHWAWWDGWDPYYTSCSAFDFRVYWGWSWGPRYWFGTVPYFCYVPRCYPCAPYDRPYYSSWHGPREWRGLWGGNLVRHKSPPPPGYTPPGSYDWKRWADNKPLPPGFMRSEPVRGSDGRSIRVPVGSRGPRTDVRGGDLRPGLGRTTRGQPGDSRDGAAGPGGYGRSAPGERPAPVRVTPGGGKVSPGREVIRGGSQTAPGRRESGGEVRPAPAPRNERPREEVRSSPAPAPRNDSPRESARPAPSPSRSEQPSGSSSGDAGYKSGGRRPGR